MVAAGYGALLDALRGLTWPARRPSRGGTAGTHVSKLRGASAEFTEYRQYSPGDDPKNLDFRSAVEEFQCDQKLSVDGVVGPATRARLVKAYGC